SALMRSRTLLGMTGGAAIVALGLACATGCAIAQTLTAPYAGRRYSTRVLGLTERDGRPMVQLEDVAQTRQQGRYGAFLPDGQHVRFGTDAFTGGDHLLRSVSDSADDSLAGAHE